MATKTWAIGVDLGGTKVEVAQVDVAGQLLRQVRRPTPVKAGPFVIQSEIAAAVSLLVCPAKLGNLAGVVGAAAFAIRSFT